MRGEVDELERAPEPLAPPAVAGRAVDRPVVERVPPALAGRAERVRRRAGDLAAREQLRPAGDVGAAVGDVDRQVADQPDAALGRVRAQRSPLPLEAHLVGDRVRAGEAAPSPPVQNGWRATKSSISAAVTRAVGLARSCGEAAKADGERYGEPNSSGGPSGSICHHDWPAAASQSTNRYASRSSLPGRERGRMEQDAGRTRRAPRFDPPSSVRLAACRSRRRRPAADPDPGGDAAGRLRPLPRQAHRRRRASR